MFCVWVVLSDCVIYVLVLCVCVCDTVHVFTQQEIGLLWGGFRTGESSYCIIQLLEPETAISQGCILDEFDCPLLTMVDFCVIPSSSVCAAVSVVHKCTTTCSFVEKTASAVVEGCDTSVIVHDWTNTVYCNNIYCLKKKIIKAMVSKYSPL